MIRIDTDKVKEIEYEFLNDIICGKYNNGTPLSVMEQLISCIKMEEPGYIDLEWQNHSLYIYSEIDGHNFYFNIPGSPIYPDWRECLGLWGRFKDCIKSYNNGYKRPLVYSCYDECEADELVKIWGYEK